MVWVKNMNGWCCFVIGLFKVQVLEDGRYQSLLPEMETTGSVFGDADAEEVLNGPLVTNKIRLR